MQSNAVGKAIGLALGVMLASGGAQAADVVGVAFVHGTGKQTDARAEYWQPGIIDTVRQGLPNSANYTVVNCDFEQYMWKPEAAGCLAGQLTTFINSKGITRLVVITHSNGGNVVRWILSNPTYDSRYPKLIQTISKVTALAPSSAGTPLADAVLNGNVFEASVGWLLGYQNDAGPRRCQSRSARWSARTWSRRCGTATATAAVTRRTWGWSSPRTGSTVVPTASSNAAARRLPARCCLPTRRAPRAPNPSATTRAGATASAWARSCATT